MKRLAACLITVCAVGLLLSTPSSGDAMPQKGPPVPHKKVNKRVTKPVVPFQRTPKRLSPDLFAGERAKVNPPAPLPASKRRQLIRETRIAARLDSSLVAQLPENPPPHVRLAPEAPASNKSYFSVWRGSHYPSGQGAMIDKDCPYAVVHPQNGGRFIFDFWTEPEKSYFLDISVSPDVQWSFTGGVEATVSPVDGHLIVGFRANSDRTEIRFWRTEPTDGFFYGAELTKID